MTERERHLEDLVDSLGAEVHRQRLELDMLREAATIRDRIIERLEAAIKHTIEMFSSPNPTEVNER